MNKPPPFKGLNITIPIIIPIKGRGFINQGSGLAPFMARSTHVSNGNCASHRKESTGGGSKAWNKSSINAMGLSIVPLALEGACRTRALT